MKKFILAFLSFLPGISFAASINDIGELIFRDILKMNVYPGSPFSGNIINDIVMFLIIPTIFIIVVITILVLRLGLPSQKLAVLMGIGFYLFIIFGGYYSMFALLAGPYFLFLLIIIGILAFFLGHFGVARQGGPMHGRAAGGGMAGSAVAIGNNPYVGLGFNELRKQLNQTNEEIKNTQRRLAGEEAKRDRLIQNAKPGVHIEAESGSISRLNEQLMELERRKVNIEYAMGAIKGKW